MHQFVVKVVHHLMYNMNYKYCNMTAAMSYRICAQMSTIVLHRLVHYANYIVSPMFNTEMALLNRGLELRLIPECITKYI